MTTNEALAILDQATAQLNAPRKVHIQITEALQLLKEELSKTDK